ncbi:peptidoglycan-binding domain-containing protein [Candidatus Frankia alpina]|uniref:Peptidoglycan-binding protein n=1 Tax=Candidatus Frankia alpina TaxID=2699483 RepID=A0A4S5EQY9_9ACTN|nr:peptidoglycan-binding protein [Candidatus Frankia alpina]THJ74726.1 peptidoglycan-binding protein [Candidatus Frankia alpina]
MALVWPIQKPGDAGLTVQLVQYLLRAHDLRVSVDGAYGPRTAAAVRDFQTRHRLTPDGQVGQQTWPVLIVPVQSGSRGQAVHAVQDASHTLDPHYQPKLALDGEFGSHTDAWVRHYQGVVHALVDGEVGLTTWNHLVKADRAS